MLCTENKKTKARKRLFCEKKLPQSYRNDKPSPEGKGDRLRWMRFASLFEGGGGKADGRSF